jgi:hypothetical protein
LNIYYICQCSVILQATVNGCRDQDNFSGLAYHSISGHDESDGGELAFDQAVHTILSGIEFFCAEFGVSIGSIGSLVLKLLYLTSAI